MYHILGDPATRLAVPPEDVRLRLFDDATGEALGDSLPRGRRIRVEGEVHGNRDRSVSDLRASRAGTAQIRVTDAPVRRTVSASYDQASYDANPRTAYELTAPVTGGRFTARFLVPVEATTGAGARVTAYASGWSGDASGAAVARIVDGTPDPADSTGPVITVRFAGGGSVVGPNETVIITIEDPSGIRTLDDSPLDPIRILLDDGTPADLTAAFRYDGGSSSRGSADFVLPGLSEGAHTIEVSASDNLAAGATRSAHRSTVTVEFRVAAVVASAEARAWVLPNPFRAAAGTDLVFTGTAGASTAEVRVYDVRGRLVRRLLGTSDGGHVEVRWDGRDSAGSTLAAGIYLYRSSVVSAGVATRRFDGRLVLLR